MMGPNNYFKFVNSIKDLLFQDLTVSSPVAFLIVCIGVAVFVFLYEILKSIRYQLAIISGKETKQELYLNDDQIDPQNTCSTLFCLSRTTKRRLKFHCLQTFLYMIQITMGYILMLIVMTWNAWFLITVVLATSLSYYFHEFFLARKPLIVPVEIAGTS